MASKSSGEWEEPRRSFITTITITITKLSGTCLCFFVLLPFKMNELNWSVYLNSPPQLHWIATRLPFNGFLFSQRCCSLNDQRLNHVHLFASSRQHSRPDCTAYLRLQCLSHINCSLRNASPARSWWRKTLLIRSIKIKHVAEWNK